MCLREPHLSRHVDHAGSLPDGELRGGSSVGNRGEDRAEICSAFLMDRDITGLQIYYIIGKIQGTQSRQIDEVLWPMVKSLDLL